VTVPTSARTPDRGTKIPLWAQVRADLERRLEAGAFTGGFPGELALVDEYGVSRHTVREALRSLRAQGAVVAGRGHRPRVAQVHEQSMGALWSFFRAIEAEGHVQDSDVLRLEVRADARVAGVLGRPPGTELLFLERLRRADGEPLAWDRAWLPADVARPLLDVDFRHTALYDELAGRCGVVMLAGQETVEARTADELTRDRLEVPLGSPVLVLTRIGHQQDRPLELRETVVRGDRFRLTVAWSGTRGDGLELRGVMA